MYMSHDHSNTLKSSVSSVEKKQVDVSLQWCYATGAKFCILKSANYKNDGIV